MILRIVLFGLLFYFLYKLVFDLVIPVYRTTKQVRKGFTDIQTRMNEYQDKNGQPGHAKGASGSPGKGKIGEYIEFEEVK